MLDGRHPIQITCTRGASEPLAGEVAALGFQIRSTHDAGVETTGTLTDTWRLNLWLRAAYNVLFLLRRGACRSTRELYQLVASMAWEDVIPVDGYLTVVSRVDTPKVNNSMYSNLIVKDAIVDRIQSKLGRRPNSGSSKDGVVVTLYWKNERCWIYLNTSGRKLSDRGYRKMPHIAPLQEALAASILLTAGYDGSQPLVTPMCGSGTFAIEAALIAQRRAPGLFRSEFGFMKVKGFDPDAWRSVRIQARKAKTKDQPTIVATDLDPKAIGASRQNARTAGVDMLIDFSVCDFAATPLPRPPGILVVNPEYGLRLGDTTDLSATYARFGDFLKQRCAGYRAYLITGNRELSKRIGLKPKRRIPLFNADIECRLFEYELYEGTRGEGPTTRRP